MQALANAKETLSVVWALTAEPLHWIDSTITSLRVTVINTTFFLSSCTIVSVENLLPVTAAPNNAGLHPSKAFKTLKLEIETFPEVSPQLPDSQGCSRPTKN
jgi:hypothetical protein